MVKICLIIVFNHRFEKNLPRLREIYKGRFSNIYFLMPFYKGTDTDVITVYDSSFYFQGYFAQGFKTFFDEMYTHYVFIADDMFLNPDLNEFNLLEEMQLESDTAYIKNLAPIDRLYFLYVHLTKILEFPDYVGVNIANEMPTIEKMKESLDRLGLETKESLDFKAFKHWDGTYHWADIKRLGGIIGRFKVLWKLWRGIKVKYPLIAGYSDFLIIPSIVVKPFCHYCGLTAASQLWVEVAIPTILTFLNIKITTEMPINEHWLSPIKSPRPLHGVELWNEEVDAFNLKYEKSYAKLASEFPPDWLYVHPIKLSQWKD